ncbi:MAG: hypothetical protein V1744_03075 [Candidatus Altiarchaeota archaeon]
MPRGKRKEESKGDRTGTVILVLGCLVVLVFVLAYAFPKAAVDTTKYGVKVVSEIPLENLRRMEYIALYNDTSSPAEVTCKFELSAISKPDPNGYRVSVGEGDYGIYVKSKEASIKGRDEEEILTACHVFACLRDGIECPNFMALGSFIKSADSMSVILDGSAGQATGRGYAEVVGVLGYVQSKKADLDGDGVISQSEVNANEFFIYPFVKDGDSCQAMPLNNLIQNWSGDNRTTACSNIEPAIILTNSNESAIRLDGQQVIISGSDDQIHTGAVILRDFIAPDWIRRMYGIN